MNVKIEYTVTRDIAVENVVEWLYDAATTELKQGKTGYSENLTEAAKVIEKLVSLLEEQREATKDIDDSHMSKVYGRMAFKVCRMLEELAGETLSQCNKETLYYLKRMEEVISSLRDDGAHKKGRILKDDV